ncbi:Hypothetical protein MVR_LOCUS96 [uncultured virus]|nr:Hypothetical protein MVR_LOCUS96 [uncultured virus]
MHITVTIFPQTYQPFNDELSVLVALSDSIPDASVDNIPVFKTAINCDSDVMMQLIHDELNSKDGITIIYHNSDSINLVMRSTLTFEMLSLVKSVSSNVTYLNKDEVGNTGLFKEQLENDETFNEFKSSTNWQVASLNNIKPYDWNSQTQHQAYQSHIPTWPLSTAARYNLRSNNKRRATCDSKLKYTFDDDSSDDDYSEDTNQDQFYDDDAYDAVYGADAYDAEVSDHDVSDGDANDRDVNNNNTN